jgi:pilus assembly protein Flp/PilA
MRNLMIRLLRDNSGATAIEYGLITALIAIALITAASVLGNAINDEFFAMSNRLNVQ